MLQSMLLAALASAAPPPLACDETRTLQAALPHGVEIAAGSWATAVLGIEERGTAVEVTALGTRHDMPPDARAFDLVVFDAGDDATAIVSAREEGTASAELRLTLHCFSGGGDAALAREYSEASALLASAEMPQAAESATAARHAAITRFERLAGGNATSRWPWLIAQSQHALGFLHARMNATEAATARYASAIAAWEALGERERAGWARLRLAQQQRKAGDLAAARAAMRTIDVDALAGIDDSLLVAYYNDDCLLRRLDGDTAAARDCYLAALAPARRLGRAADTATLLANLADARLLLGDYDGARTDVLEALELARAVRSQRAELLALAVAGGVDRAVGRTQEALAHYARAGELAAALGNAAMRANLSFQLATTWALLDEPGHAIAAAREARGQYAALGHGAREARAALLIENLRIERLDGDGASARTVLAAAAALQGEGEDPRSARLLAARTCLALRDAACARSLVEDDAGDAAAPYALAQSRRLARARLAALEARPAQAAAHAIDALRAAHARDDVLAQIEARQALGEARAALGERSPAREEFEAAFDLSLDVAALQTYPLHRQRMLARARESLAWLLRLDAAGARAEDTRHRWRRLASQASVVPDWRGAVGEARFAQVNAVLQRHWQLDGTAHAASDDALTTALLAAWRNDTPAARSEHAPVPADDDIWETFVDDEAVHWWWQDADGVHRRSFAFDRARRQQAMARLHRALADPKSDAAALTREARDLAVAIGLDFAVRTHLAAGQRDVAARDHAAREHATRGDATREHAARDTSGASSRRGAGARADASPAQAAGDPLRLMPDGALAGLPLTWMAELVATPGNLRTQLTLPGLPARTDTAATPCCASHRLYALADPTPAEGAEGAATLVRLPGTRREARAIGAAWTPGRSDLLLGSAATARAALDALANADAVVHLATHGLVRPGESERSGLLLTGDDGRLRVLGLGELLAADVQAALVVLSACDAGNAQPLAATASTSLAQALLHAGADRVVAPLWSLHDAASEHWMRAFYTALATGTPPDAAALAARRALQATPGWEHPYFWAGLQLFEGALRYSPR